MARNVESQRAAKLRWYRKNKARQLARQAERRRELRDAVRAAKIECGRCGYDDTRALVFHHRDGTEKDADIAKMVNDKLGRDRIMAEIEKCDVICANCHAIEHHAA